MMKLIKSLAVASGLGMGLAACSGSNSVTLTPPPPVVNTTYYQIERLSRPAVKEVFEPFVQHQTSNAAEPYNDPTLQADIKATEDALRPPNKTLGSDYGAAIAGVLYPDEYLVNLDGAKGGFLGAEVAALGAPFGGRTVTDDVVNLELGVAFGTTLSALGLQPADNETNYCLSKENVVASAGPQPTNTFPYLAAAH